VPEAFDISAFQGRPHLEWFLEMAGIYELGWVQLWGLGPNGNGPNPDAEYQLQQIRQAGMRQGGYIVVYPDVSDATDALVSSALAAAGSERGSLSFVAPDVEPETPLRMERLLNCRDQIKWQTSGKLTPIYSNPRYWEIAFGSPDVPWPHVDEDPLIEARYYLPSGQAPDTAPDLDWRWQPFGGWSQRAMLQYAGSPITFGVEADRSVFDYARMTMEEDMGVTQDDIMAIKQELWKQAKVLEEMAGTDDAIKQLLWQINDRVKALEATGHDAAPTEQKLTDLDARIKKAGQALSG